MSMKDHLNTIARYVNNWVTIERDYFLHKNPSDLHFSIGSHTVYGNYKYNYYYSTSYHAIICSDCCAL